MRLNAETPVRKSLNEALSTTNKNMKTENNMAKYDHEIPFKRQYRYTKNISNRNYNNLNELLTSDRKLWINRVCKHPRSQGFLHSHTDWVVFSARPI